jgi:phosphonatase-like hydrolase
MDSNKKIQLVVFDMAGTTVDEGNVVYKTLRMIVNKYGGDFSLGEVLEQGGGKEKRQAIQDLLVNRFDEVELPSRVDAAFAEFKETLAMAYANLEVRPCPGTEELFAFLRKQKIQIVLNTGYNEATAQSLVDKLGWIAGRDFDLLITADMVEHSRPAPDMILLAMKRLGINDPGAVAKIGDTAIDMEEGHEAGCGLLVGITSGAQTRDQITLGRPHHIIDHLSSLPALLGK